MNWNDTKKIWSGGIMALMAMFLFGSTLAFAQTAEVQVIHNAPVLEIDTVNVYINDNLAIESLAYMNATSFVEVSSGETKIDIVAKDSTDNDNPLFTKTVTLEDGGKYIVVAAGNPFGDEGYEPFDLFVKAGAQMQAATAGNAEFTVFHGSPDAPVVDVATEGGTTLADSLYFGAFTDGYTSVAAEDYVLDISSHQFSNLIASYNAPLSGFADSSFVVMAKGIYNKSLKYDSFGLSVVFPSGEVIELTKTDEPLYPYPPSEDTPVMGDDYIFFVDGANVDVQRVGGMTDIEKPDEPGNIISRISANDYGSAGFYFEDTGINMQQNIEDRDTLFMKIRVLPEDGTKALAISIDDYSEDLGGENVNDLGFTLSWPIPDSMYDGQWRDLALPLPRATKAAHDTAVAHGEVGPIEARWDYINSYSGTYSVGPDDPLWRDFTWFKVEHIGIRYGASGSGQAYIDDFYIGGKNTDLSVAAETPNSPVPTLNASLNAAKDSIIVTWSHDPNSDIPGYFLYYTGDDVTNYGTPGQVRTMNVAAGEGPDFMYKHPVYSPHPEDKTHDYNFELYASNQYSFVPAEATPSEATVTTEGKSVPYIYALTADQETEIMQNFANEKVGLEGFNADVMKPFDLSGTPTVNNDGDAYYGDADLSGKIYVAYRHSKSEGYTTFYIYAEVRDDQVDELTSLDGEGSWIHDFGAPFFDARLPWNFYTKMQLNFQFGTYGVNYVTGSTNYLRDRGEKPDYFVGFTPYVETAEENMDPSAIKGLLTRLWLEDARLPIDTEGDTTYYYSSEHQFIYPPVYEQMKDENGNYIGWKMLAAIDAQDLIADQNATDTPFVAPGDDEIKYIPFAIDLIDRDAESPWWGSGHEFTFNTKPSGVSEVSGFVDGIGAVAVAGINRVVTAIDDEPVSRPNSYSLEQNFPNPFNPTTTIQFSLAKPGQVNLTVYNLLGRKVATLINDQRYNAGKHVMRFDASSLSSGMYFYRIKAGDFTATKSMMLIK